MLSCSIAQKYETYAANAKKNHEIWKKKKNNIQKMFQPRQGEIGGKFMVLSSENLVISSCLITCERITAEGFAMDLQRNSHRQQNSVQNEF